MKRIVTWRRVLAVAVLTLVLALAYASAFFARCGYTWPQALATWWRDPTPRNQKYYFVPKGTTLSELTAKLGPPGERITTTARFHDVRRTLSRADYTVPERSPSGTVLWYGTVGGLVKTYQVFYFFDETGGLEETFVGEEEYMVLVYVARDARDTERALDLLEQANVRAKRMPPKGFPAELYVPRRSKLEAERVLAAANPPSRKGP